MEKHFRVKNLHPISAAYYQFSRDRFTFDLDTIPNSERRKASVLADVLELEKTGADLAQSLLSQKSGSGPTLVCSVFYASQSNVEGRCLLNNDLRIDIAQIE